MKYRFELYSFSDPMQHTVIVRSRKEKRKLLKAFALSHFRGGRKLMGVTCAIRKVARADWKQNF